MSTQDCLTTGWLRLVGSIKLNVSIAKEPYKRDYILQKRQIILSILLIETTPYFRLSKQISPRHSKRHSQQFFGSQILGSNNFWLANVGLADFWRAVFLVHAPGVPRTVLEKVSCSRTGT